jgi:Spy/CpxP family protein refolding chaperone
MISSSAQNHLSFPRSRGTFFRTLALVAAVGGLSVSLFAQAPADNAGGGGGRQRRGQNGGNGGNGGNFDPAQMQQRMLDNLKEQMGVTDDAEWAVISDRVTKVFELRRSTAGGGFGGRGGGGGGRQGRQGGATANPEMDALRAAVTDKLPDAEVKARLDKFREVRKANEEKLVKAQEDLRAVLSVRQEAVLVMAGMLP